MQTWDQHVIFPSYLHKENHVWRGRRAFFIIYSHSLNNFGQSKALCDESGVWCVSVFMFVFTQGYFQSSVVRTSRRCLSIHTLTKHSWIYALVSGWCGESAAQTCGNTSELQRCRVGSGRAVIGQLGLLVFPPCFWQWMIVRSTHITYGAIKLAC